MTPMTRPDAMIGTDRNASNLSSGKVVEELEPAVFRRVPRNRHLLRFLGHPAGDAFSNLHGNLSDQPGMWILRRPQDQKIFGLIEQIKQARIASRHLDDESDDLLQHFIQIQRGTDGVS